MLSITNAGRAATIHVIERWWQRLGAPGLVCLAVGKDPPRSMFFRQVDIEQFICGHENEHLFFCPHTFAALQPGADGFHDALVKNHGSLLGRINECSVPCRALWADLDHVDPNKLGALEPTIAIESSPKRYAGLWLTDGIVADISLNKRLTYHVGADKGGWCRTKLLRLPGSRNRKYRPPPRALVLWDDGPVHRLADLERVLPPLAEPTAHAPSPTGVGERGEEEEGEVCTGARAPSPSTPPMMRIKRVPTASSDTVDMRARQAAAQILAAYNVRSWTRHELLHGKPNGEDRSGALWGFAKDVFKAGVPAGEAGVVLMGSAWSRGREDDVARVIRKIWSRR